MHFAKMYEMQKTASNRQGLFFRSILLFSYTRAQMQTRTGVAMTFFEKCAAFFANCFANFSLADILDIALIAIFVFYLYRFIRERRAGKLALGVVFLFALNIVSGWAGLETVEFVLDHIFEVGLLALVVVFQPELRSMLEQVGGDSFKGIKNLTMNEAARQTSKRKMIADLCSAVCDMAKEKTGALIVLERTTKLGDVAGTGTPLNAEISSSLLQTIFYDKAPLHDGAVIIREGKIAAAGCFLPLTEQSNISRELGTRHRAALGMSENSDAIVLVVSEETGVISIARAGKLKRNYDYVALQKALTELLGETSKEEAPAGAA